MRDPQGSLNPTLQTSWLSGFWFIGPEETCVWLDGEGKEASMTVVLNLILPAQKFYITLSLSWEDIINYDYYYSLVVTYEY